jgi:plasmid stabilization system protein ParE
MKICLTPEAEEQAGRCDEWWRENRPATRDLFAQELLAAKALLLAAPNIGPVYAVLDGRRIRRLLLEKTRNHIYYGVDVDHQIITVYSIWGAPKGRVPSL